MWLPPWLSPPLSLSLSLSVSFPLSHTRLNMNMNMNMIIGINVVAIDGNDTSTVNPAQGRTHRKQSRRLIGNHFAREIDVKLSPKLTEAERQKSAIDFPAIHWQFDNCSNGFYVTIMRVVLIMELTWRNFLFWILQNNNNKVARKDINYSRWNGKAKATC